MARERVVSVRWYADDFLSGCFDLTPDERGVYITIISQIISEGGPIDDDDRRNARMSNCSQRKFRTIKLTLIEAGKLRMIGGKIGQKRTEKELNSARTRSESATESAEIRWEKEREKAEKPNENKEADDANAYADQHTEPMRNGMLPVPVPEPYTESPSGDSVCTLFSAEAEAKRDDQQSSSRLSRLPKTTQLSADWVRIAEDAGRMSETEAHEVFRDFCEHWWSKAGQKAKKRDWTATWRTWCRSDITQRGLLSLRRNRGPDGGGAVVELREHLTAALIRSRE